MKINFITCSVQGIDYSSPQIVAFHVALEDELPQLDASAWKLDIDTRVHANFDNMDPRDIGGFITMYKGLCSYERMHSHIANTGIFFKGFVLGKLRNSRKQSLFQGEKNFEVICREDLGIEVREASHCISVYSLFCAFPGLIKVKKTFFTRFRGIKIPLLWKIMTSYPRREHFASCKIPVIAMFIM